MVKSQSLLTSLAIAATTINVNVNAAPNNNNNNVNGLRSSRKNNNNNNNNVNLNNIIDNFNFVETDDVRLIAQSDQFIRFQERVSIENDNGILNSGGNSRHRRILQDQDYLWAEYMFKKVDCDHTDWSTDHYVGTMYPYTTNTPCYLRDVCEKDTLEQTQDVECHEDVQVCQDCRSDALPHCACYMEVEFIDYCYHHPFEAVCTDSTTAVDITELTDDDNMGMPVTETAPKILGSEDDTTAAAAAAKTPPGSQIIGGSSNTTSAMGNSTGGAEFQTKKGEYKLSLSDDNGIVYVPELKDEIHCRMTPSDEINVHFAVCLEYDFSFTVDITTNPLTYDYVESCGEICATRGAPYFEAHLGKLNQEMDTLTCLCSYKECELPLTKEMFENISSHYDSMTPFHENLQFDSHDFCRALTIVDTNTTTNETTTTGSKNSNTTITTYEHTNNYTRLLDLNPLALVSGEIFIEYPIDSDLVCTEVTFSQTDNVCKRGGSIGQKQITVEFEKYSTSGIEFCAEFCGDRKANFFEYHAEEETVYHGEYTRCDCSFELCENKSSMSEDEFAVFLESDFGKTVDWTYESSKQYKVDCKSD